LKKYNYKKPTEEHYKKVIHSFINKELLPQNIVVLNDDLKPFIAIQDKRIIYTEGDEVDVDGLILFHLNQYLFYKDLKSLEWLKDNYADLLGSFIIFFDKYFVRKTLILIVINAIISQYIVNRQEGIPNDYPQKALQWKRHCYLW